MKPIKNPEEPLAIWTGQDRIQGEIHSSVTAIIRSGGCSWNRCKMCQYRHERFSGIETAELISLMTAQIKRLEDEITRTDPKVVKVYTSGSFFDPCEVPKVIQDKIISLARGKILIVESRCDYIKPDSFQTQIEGVKDDADAGELYVAIGLETTSDNIREKCIDKGLLYSDYLKTTKIIHDAGAKVKTYLLHKPPYLSEAEAHADMVRSIHEIIPVTDLISMNPCTVQRNTHLESFMETTGISPAIFMECSSILAGAPVHTTCDPIGGGQTRGPHNCGSCDSMILDAIRDYNLNADQELMKSVLEMDCGCKKEWEYVMDQEKPWAMPLTR